MNTVELIEKLGRGSWSERAGAAAELLSGIKEAQDEVVLALTDDNDDIRYWALKILAESSPEKYAGYAEEMLGDEAWFVRSQAALLLSETGNSSYVSVLEKALLNERDPEAAEYFRKSISVLSSSRKTE